MHVTRVIYFPFQDVMCNMLYQWRKCWKFVKWESMFVRKIQWKHEVKLLCFSNELLALNVTKNRPFYWYAIIKTQKNCSEQRHASRSHAPFMSTTPWNIMLSFQLLKRFEDLFYLTSVLLSVLSFFLFEAAFFAFPQYGSSPFALPWVCALCFVFKKKSVLSVSFSLFTVSDIYKDKICCAIPLKAHRDNLHLPFCSL